MKRVISIMAAMSMAGAMSAYAAPSLATPKASPSIAALSQAKAALKPETVQDQIDQLYSGLKPGQVIAYYVKDSKLNPLDQILFAGKGFVFQNYNDYLAKAEKLKAPELSKPAVVPKGYVFKAGILYLQNPDKHSEVYMQLDKELKEQAAKGKKNLYTKFIEVSEASSATLTFIKNKTEVSIVSTYAKPSEPIGGTPVPNQDSKHHIETMQINGIECTYTKETKGRDHLDWSAPSKGIRYSIWAENAKSDVIGFAKGMIK